MYAPTFRGNNANNAHFPFDKLDLTAWGKFLDETDSVLIVKLHPFVKGVSKYLTSMLTEYLTPPTTER